MIAKANGSVGCKFGDAFLQFVNVPDVILIAQGDEIGVAKRDASFEIANKSSIFKDKISSIFISLLAHESRNKFICKFFVVMKSRYIIENRL